MKTYKHVTQTVTKRVRAVIRPGVNYDNIKAVQAARATGELPAENAGLPWGQWAEIDGKKLFPYVIAHKGSWYFRFTRAANTGYVTQYFIDGEPATKEKVEPLCLAGEFRAEGPESEVFTVKAENVLSIGETGEKPAITLHINPHAIARISEHDAKL